MEKQREYNRLEIKGKTKRIKTTQREIIKTIRKRIEDAIKLI